MINRVISFSPSKACQNIDERYEMKIRGKFDVINLIAWIFVRGFSLELYYTLHLNTAVCLLKFYY